MTANFMLVSDDKYTKNLGICTYSVLHNMCPAVEHVRIFVMDCGITEENKAKLRRQAARFDNAELVFHNIEQQLDEVSTQVETHWHKAIYGRLFFPELLAKYDNMARLIYLDCDLLMNQPVTELFEMDLQGKCLAGIADGYSYARKLALGIDMDCTYINSGVLVIDTARWTALNASKNIIAYLNSFPEKLIYPDQDAINAVLAHEILILHPRYNFMWAICQNDIPKMLRNIDHFYYSAEELSEGLQDAAIYHYAGHDMWTIDGLTPVHTDVFRKYRRLCDWRDCRRHFSSIRNGVLWLMIDIKHKLLGIR